MKRYGRFALSTAALSVALMPGGLAPAAAQSITEALTSAYATNPDLAADIAELKSVNEGVAQALSGYRPTVTAEASISSQFTNTTLDGVGSGVSLSGTTDSGGGTTGNWHEVNPAEIGITVTQSIYRGGRTEASVNQAENTIQATRAVVQTTEQTVLLNAATAYADVIAAQATVDLTRNNEVVLRRTLQATQDRFDVGELTRTDVSQAQADLAGATADRVAAEGTLRAARATFERFVGLPPVTLETPPVPGGLPPSLQQTIQRAQSNNPAIAAALFTERAAADNIDLQFGALLPELTVQLQLTRQYSTISHPASSSGAQSRVDSAALVANLTIPLYQAGGQESLVRQARYTHGQRRIEIESQRRIEIEGAVQAWELLVTARASIQSLQAQVQAQQLTVEGVEQELLVGSRTVIEVLDAQQDLLQAQVDLVTARRNEVVAGYQILDAVGTLTARDLGLRVEIYDPEPDYQNTRARWIGTSIDE